MATAPQLPLTTPIDNSSDDTWSGGLDSNPSPIATCQGTLSEARNASEPLS